MTNLYLNPHSSQYQPGASTITRHAGCTWTSGANGVNASTGGRKHPTPDEIHQLLPSSAETNPTTPGWSLPDLVKALARIGVPLDNRTGQGWLMVEAALASGCYVALQGDSDQFANTTCSGAFDGDHCIGVHPKTKVEGGERWYWVDDPICATGRWERASVLRRYAEKLYPGVRFGVFTTPVPAIVVAPPVPEVTLRYGARRLKAPVTKTVRIPKGRRGRIRTKPRIPSHITRHVVRGQTFRAWQVTTKGTSIGGSSRWYGNRTGTRWAHSSLF